jgi:hypothetical protein
MPAIVANLVPLQALDKLSRLSTPSPSRNTRSPAPTQTVGSSAASSSSKSSSSHTHTSSQSHVRSQSHAQPIQLRRQISMEAVLSGSETERESQHTLFAAASYSSSTEDLPAIAPPSSTRPQSSLGVYRQRNISGPTSPEKAIAHIAGAYSPTHGRTPRKRPSTAASTRDEDVFSDRHGDRDKDVTSAALAAVASSRRSPTANGKRRAALPREFRDRRGSLDHEVCFTLLLLLHFYHCTRRLTATCLQSFGEAWTSNDRRGPPSPNAHISFSNTQNSPPRSRQNRPSPREPPRRHQARWQSEDMGPSVPGDRGPGEDPGSSGRRQSRRTGSVESILGSGRSLLGEGLKAAGILKRKDDYVGKAAEIEQGPSSSSSAADRRKGNVDWADELRARGQERELERSRSRVGMLQSINGEATGPPPREQTDRRTPDVTNTDAARALVSQSGSRPPTSMGNRSRGNTIHEDRGPDVLALRKHPESVDDASRWPLDPDTKTHNSAHALPERDWARAGAESALSRYSASQQPPRTTSSPFGNRRYSPIPSGSLSATSAQFQLQAEHTRLMMESLSMFESQLARVPPLGTTSTVTIPELYRSAQGIIQASDRLNIQLRAGTVKALEKQIEAEIGEVDEAALDPVGIWRRVGGEYRETLRISDELVRTMTGFLLGIGKVLRETVALAGGPSNSSHHGRSMSVEDEGLRRNSPDVGGSASGRRSVEERSESRGGWEPRVETLRRFSSRVDGILAGVPRPLSALRNRELDREHESLSPAVTGNTQAASSTSVRRLFTPREQREERFNASTNASFAVTSDSLETLGGYEPSPTPAPRQHHDPAQVDHPHTLPPLTIPSPLAALPSESSTRHPQKEPPHPQKEPPPDKSLHDRRKASNTSIVTVRPSPMSFPALTLPNPTTAVTPHTVSNSPDNAAFPLFRSNSASSSRSGVTFSKPSAVSVSTLTGLQQQHSHRMHRTISSSTASSHLSQPKSTGTGPSTPLSGSETERDNRRRTFGAKTARASLDGALHSDRRGESGSGTHTRPPISNNSKKERRRTLTEIFSQG